jgi:hypothetical protein
MAYVQQQTPERQALAEISLICSGALSHGADSAGVVEIIEAISAKARAPLMEKPAASTKKAVLDDTGEQWGYGDTVEEARKDAVDHIMYLSKDELREFIVVLVEDMTVIDVTAEEGR